MILDMVEELKQKLEDAMADAEKADKGNKAAGTRVRKTMQDVANGAKELRKAVLAARN